jgi:type I restriction enzyme M protein
MESDTKRHIDNARRILVGVVPNPISQIDQITYALIYKFMDDMDQSALKEGGEASFFTGDLEHYSWSHLLSPRIGNQERLNLYVEAFNRFAHAPQLPALFRDILKNAYLPYRSPEVLGLFLKEIEYFDYSHPEELGNAYEYLLSIMGSQGDAGQFRTPRHLIDFIVDVVQPTEKDKILDPACGTGGFLVKAYQHILAQHSGEKRLTPSQKQELMDQIEGYDIDPGMVRIAQVNMFLHQFKNPKIYQYDTLSMEERWREKFDVIMANPPFMSPKGGIKPHNKFSVKSTRSEVLFVDYIMNHLKPKGRAGIIVPEGIIFQSGKAYKQLRKNLIQDGLYAVVSLPSGIFQPYSGVKTSVLLFNNDLARQNKELLFVKVESDGYDLGAQRRPNNKNDLPKALEIIRQWEYNKKIDHPLALYVEKSKIAENGDYNLSGDRYRVAIDYSNAKWPMVKLGEVCEIEKGSSITKKDTINGEIPVIAGGQQPAYFHNQANRRGDTITVSASGAYAGFVNYFDIPIFASDCTTVQSKNETEVLTKYIFLTMKHLQDEFYKLQKGMGQPHVYGKDFAQIQIPLPPLEIQQQIVAELDGYQNIIAGAKQIIANWKPTIDIDPGWPKVKLGEVCDVRDGTHDSPKQVQAGYPLITSKNIKNGQLNFSDVSFISENDFHKVSKRSYVDIGDIIMPMIGTIGGCCLIESKEKDFAIKNVALFKKTEKMLSKFLFILLSSDFVESIFKKLSAGATQKFISLSILRNLQIPLPPLEIQHQIVEKIETEHTLVESAKKLIQIYEQKTKATLEKLWEH